MVVVGAAVVVGGEVVVGAAVVVVVVVVDVELFTDRTLETCDNLTALYGAFWVGAASPSPSLFPSPPSSCDVTFVRSVSPTRDRTGSSGDFFHADACGFLRTGPVIGGEDRF